MSDLVANPLGTSVAARSSAMIASEEARAIAEVQAAALVARANPRDPVRAMDLILQDCTRATLAEVAVYQYSRGGTDIVGPAIRLIEAIARRWTNIDTGIQELARRDGQSFCRAYAVDLENNFRETRTFVVRHWRDTREGGYALKDERDIRELIGNMGARYKRSCLQALIDGDVIAAAMEQCERTMAQQGDVTPEKIERMLAGFAEFEVTKEMIEKRLQRHLDSISPSALVGLRKIFAALKDGVAKVTDFFEPPRAAEVIDQPAGKSAAGNRADKIKGAMRAAKPKATPKADEAPPPAEEQPAETFADVAAALEGAKGRDELLVAADRIRFVKDEAHQSELRSILERRKPEFDDL